MPNPFSGADNGQNYWMSNASSGTGDRTRPDATSTLGATITLVDVYSRASSPHAFNSAPAAQAVHGYLESLKSGLAKSASEEGWRIAEAGDGLGSPYLLIPTRDDQDSLYITGIPVDLPSIGDSPSAKPYQDKYGRVDSEAGAKLEEDVPAPLKRGQFDRGFLYVSRDPVDALLLRTLGVNAVSLATPCVALGSEKGIRRLEAMGALDTQRTPRGTIVVVDPGASINGEWGGILCGLYDEVRVVLSSAGPADATVTGAGIADLVRRCDQPGWDTEAAARTLLLAKYENEEVAQLRNVQEIRLPPAPKEVDGWPSGYRRQELVLVSAEELDAKGDTTPWVAEPFAAAGAITDLHGPTKAGKTTFLLSLAAAVAQDGHFLDYKCKGGPVVYVSEQTQGTIRASAVGASALASGVYFLTLEATFGRGLDEIAAFVRRECRHLGAKLVVIDTLGAVARLGGDADNSSGVAREVYRSLRPLAFDGLAVVVVRHSRKGRGSIYETAAGSVTFSGEADQLVRFVKPYEEHEQRRVEVVGRLSSPETIAVEFRKPDWVKVEAKEKSKPAKAVSGFDAVVQVLKHVGEAGETVGRIAELSETVGGLRITEGTVRNAFTQIRKRGAELGLKLGTRKAIGPDGTLETVYFLTHTPP